MSLPTLSYGSKCLPRLDVSSWERLELTSSDPCRTEILDDNDPANVVYRVTTDESGRATVTIFTNQWNDTIASLEWHHYFSDKLSLWDGPKRNVGAWLKYKGTLLLRRGAYFSDDERRTYTWTNFEVGQSASLQLHAENDPTPIALFLLPKGSPYANYFEPAAILYSARASEVRDEVVLSALLLERTRRLSERDYVFEL